MMYCRPKERERKVCPAARRLQRSFIVDLYLTGMITRKIAALAQCSPSAATTVARKAGVDLRGAGHIRPVESVNPITGRVVGKFPSIRSTTANGFDESCVLACAVGRRKTHRGLMWRYA
jgi:hypothetical protein